MLRIAAIVLLLVNGVIHLALGSWFGIGYLAFALVFLIGGPLRGRGERDRETRTLEAHRDWLRRISSPPRQS